ncbi:MAG: hypothetical protein DRN30_02475 [Thermoplasmata archaeon]|nr:hypothetical protein [Euryarchaeota archaeon]RLF66253.1 MAG: hypothetical protein DRN30_02475 [Thermoplasmata archaeon]
MGEVLVERLSPTIDVDSIVIPINSTGHILIPEFYKYLDKSIKDLLTTFIESFNGELPIGYILEIKELKSLKAKVVYYVTISKEVNPTTYNIDDLKIYYRNTIKKARGSGMHSIALAPPFTNSKKILESIIRALIKEIRPHIDFFDRVYLLYYSALVRDLIMSNLDLLKPL